MVTDMHSDLVSHAGSLVNSLSCGTADVAILVAWVVDTVPCVYHGVSAADWFGPLDVSSDVLAAPNIVTVGDVAWWTPVDYSYEGSGAVPGAHDSVSCSAGSFN